MRKAWKNAQAKDLAQFTMRDINMVIAEVRAERNPANYKPVKMTITVTKSVADWLKQHAAELHCSVEELVNHAVSVYRRDDAVWPRTGSTSPWRAPPAILTRPWRFSRNN